MILSGCRCISVLTADGTYSQRERGAAHENERGEGESESAVRPEREAAAWSRRSQSRCCMHPLGRTRHGGRRLAAVGVGRMEWPAAAAASHRRTAKPGKRQHHTKAERKQGERHGNEFLNDRTIKVLPYHECKFIRGQQEHENLTIDCRQHTASSKVDWSAGAPPSYP